MAGGAKPEQHGRRGAEALQHDSSGAEPQQHGRIDKLRARVDRERERYEDRGKVFKVAWVTAAAIVVAAGLVMVIVPGPALLVIPVGLAMLSLQFAWAQWVLDKGLEGGQLAAGVAAGASRQQKILAAAALVAAVACAAAIAAAVLL